MVQALVSVFIATGLRPCSALRAACDSGAPILRAAFPRRHYALVFSYPLV